MTALAINDSSEFPVLVAQARAGNAEAMAELCRRYEPDARRAARRVLGRLLRVHLDSMDIVQSVHRRIWVGLRKNEFTFGTREQLNALLLRLARWKAADYGRKRARRAALDANRSAQELRDHASVQLPDPAHEYEVEDQFQRLLEHMDPIERRAVILRRDGHSTASAASVMGVDKDVLRVKLNRMKRRLAMLGIADEYFV